MITTLVTCIFTMLPRIDNMNEYIYCKDEQYKVEYVRKWEPLVSQYFKEEDTIKALKIIYCESRGKPTAIGKNKDGTYDKGLWQFNDRTWEWLTPKLKLESNRYDPTVSTAVASWLVYNDGWYHWNSSKHCWKGHNG